MEGKGHMMAMIESGGRMLKKEDDSIVKSDQCHCEKGLI